VRADIPEKATGGRWNRPELRRLLDHLRKGDVLVVWKLDRLSRSLRDVLTIMERIQEEKAGFRSLTEAIDTTTPAGHMMMQMIGAFAEFERAMLLERTRAGLEAARKEGCIGGRRPKLLPQQQAEVVEWQQRVWYEHNNPHRAVFGNFVDRGTPSGHILSSCDQTSGCSNCRFRHRCVASIAEQVTRG
jgi:DNA invertase Pin-like site-specific DNA recombinase